MGTNRALRLLNTSIGRKLLMAITGALLGGFLVAHLLGNLAVFRGPEAINAYAEWLKDLGVLLWVARGGLLVVFGLHLYLAVTLARENRAARPSRYAHPPTRKRSTIASRHMLVTGLLILTFVVFHLLHFTWGLIDSANARLVDGAGRHDVYRMILGSFEQPVLAWAYVAFMLALGAHLQHGGVSLLQTLGFNHETYNRPVRLGVGALVGLLVAGFIAIPVAVQLGFLTPGASS